MKYLKFGSFSAQAVALIFFVISSVLVLESQLPMSISIESSELAKQVFYAAQKFEFYIRPICLLILIKCIGEVFYWIIQMGKSRVNS